MKLYLNLVYNTGLPGGSPSYADAYQYQNRLRDYRRADIGFSYVFTERNAENHFIKELHYWNVDKHVRLWQENFLKKLDKSTM